MGVKETAKYMYTIIPTRQALGRREKKIRFNANGLLYYTIFCESLLTPLLYWFKNNSLESNPSKSQVMFLKNKKAEDDCDNLVDDIITMTS